MATVYRIKGWDDSFENNRTRQLKKLGWVPIPNDQSGDGYSTIMAEHDGVEIYGTWILLVQLASKGNPRGTLMRSNGKPHDIDSIARITRIPHKTLERAIPFLDNEIGWLQKVAGK